MENDIRKLVLELEDLAIEYLKESKSDKMTRENSLIFKGKSLAFAHSAKKIKDVLVWNGHSIPFIPDNY